jgi:PAS domain S-box-containing protein
MSASGTPSSRIDRSERYFRSWGPPAAVTLMAASALIFDALTPQVISVTTLYTGLVLIGYWLPQPRAALALALLATPLIIIGHWLSIPESTPEWQSWMNRGISLGDVWLVAVFVWRIRVLGQKLQRQIDIASDQLCEIRDLSGALEQRVEDRTAEVMQRSRELDEKNRRLRQANRELTAVYDQGLFASHLNMEGRIIRANRACVEDLGFARPDIIGKLFWEAGWWYMPETREWIRKAFERTAAGTPFREELSYVFNKDGAERVTDIAFIPIKDEAGRVTSVFVPGTDVTDRARQYRATFENAAVGIAHLSPELRWLRANGAFCRIVGWPIDELVKKSLREISHPDDFAHQRALIEQMRLGKIDSYKLDKRYIHRDGAIGWGRLTVSAVRSGDGSADFFVHVLEDISTQKRAEELLRHQAELLDQSHDAILELQIGSRDIVYWNLGAERLYGYTAAEAKGQITHELLHTRAPIPIKDIDAQIIRGRSWSGELSHTTRDGRDIVVESRIVPVSYEGEMCALETNRDITARKHAEEELAKSEERLRAIFDGTYELIGLLSPDGTLLEVNRAALEFAGDAFGKRERLVGRPFWEAPGYIHTPGAPEKLREAIARAAAGEFIRYETPLMRPSGEEVIFDVSLHPVRNKQGDVSLIVPEGRNITDRKRAEDELAKSEERFRTSIVRSPVPTALWDDREQVLAVSQSWLTAAGFRSAAEFQRVEDWIIRAYGERSSEVRELVREIIATEPEARTEELILTLGGEKRIWIFVTSGLGALSDGRRLFVTVAQDVTDRKAYEERIELLMRESHHRIKNILGLVQAVARQTAAKEPEHFVKSFAERIHALAANHDLLIDSQWQGADVEDLVRVQLAHFEDLVGSRIAIHGPKLRLNAAAAQAVGLAVHELATNASKYGALSTDTGHVDVDWRSDAHSFAISWTESGGPPVRPPDCRGFGSTVIEAMAKRTVGGEVEADYAPSGFGWHLTCPAVNALEATADIHKS